MSQELEHTPSNEEENDECPAELGEPGIEEQDQCLTQQPGESCCEEELQYS